MRLSVERLRWVLILGAVALLAVLTAYIGYGRWRALEAYRRILKKSGATLTHDTNGFTYSQSVQGKTIFLLHARRATQEGEGKWALHDADLTLYGRVDNRADRIYGKEFEYDEKLGLARALGEVHMDLQAPQSLAGGRAADAASGGKDEAEVVHVKTSGLVYLRKLGVAATNQLVEFHYGGLHGTSMGAEFNSEQSNLRLLSNVALDGELRGQPIHMVAARADLDRYANVGTITLPVVNSGARSGRSDMAVAYLRKDGSIERADATGNVVIRSGTRTITCPRVEAHMSEKNVLETAAMGGGVRLVDSDPRRATLATSRQVDATFSDSGAPASVTAAGAVRIESRAAHAGAGAGLLRSMQSDKLVARFAPTGKSTARLSEIRASGAAQAQGESLSTVKGQPQRKLAQISADELDLTFMQDSHSLKRLQPQQMFGLGHTRLQQDAPLHEQQTSEGDSLQVVFRPGAGAAPTRIASAVQTGHVVIHTRGPDKPATKTAGVTSTGMGERAVYDGDSERLVLTGQARLSDGTTSLTADTVSFDRMLDSAEAHGDVKATLEGNASSPLSGGAGGKATHILASSARLLHAPKVAEFRGSDAAPARLWQDASQVEAATLVFDGVRKTFSARPAGTGAQVHAVFAGAEKAVGHQPSASAQVVQVTAPKMDYNDALHEAVFAGGVRMQGATGDVQAQRSVVFLKQDKTPRGTGKTSIDRIVATGSVAMEQPGRRATGEELVYTGATGNFALTGDEAAPLARVVDAQQGSVTGSTLLFGDRGSTIVVSGDAGNAGKAIPHGRVHSETEVRQVQPR